MSKLLVGLLVPVVLATVALGQGGPRAGEKGVDEWLRLLEDPRPEVRSEAAYALGKIGPPAKDAIPALLKARNDRDGNVILEASEALRKMGPAVISLLEDDLRIKGDDRAGVILAKIGKDALPVLRDALGDEKLAVRLAAIKALTTMGPVALPYLKQALEAKEPLARLTVIEALARSNLPPAQTVPLIRTGLKDSDSKVRGRAILLLGDMGLAAKDAVPDLVQLLGDKDKGRRTGAQNMLERIGRDAVPALREALRSPDALVRFHAVRGLMLIRPAGREALPDVLRLTKDPDATVRQAVFEALRYYFAPLPPTALPVLLEALKDKEAPAPLVIHALSRIRPAPKEAADALLELLSTEKNPKSRSVIFEAMGEMSDHADLVAPVLTKALAEGAIRSDGQSPLIRLGKAAVPHLRKLVNDKKPKSRRAALQVLSGLQAAAADAMPEILAALDDANAEVRGAARGALSTALHFNRPPPKLAVARLTRALKDKDAAVRSYAASILRNLGHEAKEATAALLEALRDADKGVQLSAANALQDVGPTVKAALPTLRDLLKSPDKVQQSNAIRAMYGLKAEDREDVLELIQLLKQQDSPARLAVQRALAQYGAVAVTEMIALLEEKDVQIRISAVSFFAGLPSLPPEVLPPLARAMKDVDVQLRLQVLYALGRAGKPGVGFLLEEFRTGDELTRGRVLSALQLAGVHAREAQSLLLSALRDHPKIREGTTRVLIDMVPTQEAVPSLVENLRKDDASLRDASIRILQAMGPNARGAEPALREIYQNAIGTQRVQAAAALGRIRAGGKEEVAFLLQTLRERKGALRRAAATALAQHFPQTAPQAVPLIVQAMEEEPLARSLYLPALREFGPLAGDAVPVLLHMLRKDFRDRGGEILPVLESIDAPTPDAVLELRLSLTHTEERVRQIAARLLCHLGPRGREALPELRDNLQSPYTAVGLWTSAALITITGDAKEHLPLLCKTLSGPAYRETAAAALMACGPLARAAEPELRAALKAPAHPHVRLSVAAALLRLGSDDADAMSVLLAGLKSGDSRAVQALGGVGPAASAAIPALKAALQSPNPALRSAARLALLRINPKALP